MGSRVWVTPEKRKRESKQLNPDLSGVNKESWSRSGRRDWLTFWPLEINLWTKDSADESAKQILHRLCHGVGKEFCIRPQQGGPSGGRVRDLILLISVDLKENVIQVLSSIKINTVSDFKIETIQDINREIKNGAAQELNLEELLLEHGRFWRWRQRA